MKEGRRKEGRKEGRRKEEGKKKKDISVGRVLPEIFVRKSGN
ncbi:hypothetical protein L2I57_017040 [Tychonema sp. BBK16]